jgi:RNA polymerase sigma-70 factor (ECF subfamily)
MSAPGMPRVGAGAAVVSDLGTRSFENALVQRCLAGDRAAPHELHQRYYPAAAAFLRKLGTRSEEMEDAGQEVFLQFFRYLPSFRGDAQLKTWLFRLCITEARRVRRRRRLRDTVAKVLGRERPREAAVPPATHTEATLRQKFETGLDRLSPAHRLIFVLLEMEGLPANQVAEIAGCSEATVWRRLSEVRKLCQQMLGLDLPDDDDDDDHREPA